MDIQHDQARLLWKLVEGLVSFFGGAPQAIFYGWTKANLFPTCSSQAMDVGTLKSLPADTIRILVWILSFLTFGYATAEYEVTADRLGVYRPEEHIESVPHLMPF